MRLRTTKKKRVLFSRRRKHIVVSAVRRSSVKPRKNQQLKIALAGSAGTGRTIIAQRLGETLRLPVLTGIARRVLREDQYVYSQSNDVSVEKFLAVPERQLRILKHRLELERKHESFIVDRSWVDQAAYALIELYDRPDFDLTSFLDDCRDEARKFDLTVYVPWGRCPLADNGLRTLNPWYQLIVDSVVFNLIHKWELRHVSLPNNLSVKNAVKFIAKEARKVKK
jgi:hypothetical protein